MPKSTEVAFRFNMNAIADLEEQYESHMAMKSLMAEKPGTVMRDVLAKHVLKCSPQEAGERMIDAETNHYYAAIEAALALAYGATEEQAGKVAGARLELIEMTDARTIAALENGLLVLHQQSQQAASASHGVNGSKSGSSRAARKPTSGS